MTFVRVLSAERLKIKRTNALRMVVIVPLAVIILMTFFASQAPGTTLGRQRENSWQALARLILAIWSLLVLPLYIALQTALVAALEHAENQWKVLLARPIPRWMVYVAKLVVVVGFLWVSSTIIFIGILASGALLSRMDLDAHFGVVPYRQIFVNVVQITGLAFLSVTIQHWIAVRYRSFTVAVGTGIIAMVTGYIVTIMASRAMVVWTRYFPWTLPMMVITQPPVNLVPLLWFSAIAGLVVTLAGCIDLSCREMT